MNADTFDLYFFPVCVMWFANVSESIWWFMFFPKFPQNLNDGTSIQTKANFNGDGPALSVPSDGS